MKGLYIHIPFCRKICTYCDFAKEVATSSKQTAYIERLLKEMDYYQNELKDVTTLYIGGGTPSVLTHQALTKIVGHLKQYLDFAQLKEATIELNPNDVDSALSALLYKLGFTRVSLGVQTFSNAQLKFLNREHREEDVEAAIKHLRTAGFYNISIDMIFALPAQTLEALDQDIEKALQLNVEHVSYYSLILEEQTPLHYLVEHKRVTMPDEDLEGAMYERVMHRLKKAGFEHYEISNFSKHNQRSKHNMVYWKNAPYIGLGAGSHGLLHDSRYHNVRSIKKYIEAVDRNGYGIQDTYPFEPLRDHLLMGLRMLEGVSLETIQQRYGVDLLKNYPKLITYMNQNLLEIVDNHLRFTKKGLMLGNDIFAIF